MHTPCPQCNSHRIIKTRYGRKVGGAIGTTAGAMSAARGARLGYTAGALLARLARLHSQLRLNEDRHSPVSTGDYGLPITALIRPRIRSGPFEADF